MIFFLIRFSRPRVACLPLLLPLVCGAVCKVASRSARSQGCHAARILDCCWPAPRIACAARPFVHHAPHWRILPARIASSCGTLRDRERQMDQRHGNEGGARGDGLPCGCRSMIRRVFGRAGIILRRLLSLRIHCFASAGGRGGLGNGYHDGGRPGSTDRRPARWVMKTCPWGHCSLLLLSEACVSLRPAATGLGG